MDEVWEILLGKSIGPFLLGSTLSEVIYALKVWKHTSENKVEMEV